jgi:hypothetical protein
MAIHTLPEGSVAGREARAEFLPVGLASGPNVLCVSGKAGKRDGGGDRRRIKRYFHLRLPSSGKSLLLRRDHEAREGRIRFYEA